MSQIKKFIDKIAYAEARQSRDLLMSLPDAKELRDEILRLLLDSQEASKNQNSGEVIEVVMKGSKW